MEVDGVHLWATVISLTGVLPSTASTATSLGLPARHSNSPTAPEEAVTLVSLALPRCAALRVLHYPCRWVDPRMCEVKTSNHGLCRTGAGGIPGRFEFGPFQAFLAPVGSTSAYARLVASGCAPLTSRLVGPRPSEVWPFQERILLRRSEWSF